MDNMIKSVVREHHFSPAVLGDFYLDAIDYQGLVFWYDDVVKVSEELKAKSKTK